MSDEHSERPEAQANAGAFLSPFGGMVPAPMKTDDGVDAPPEPDDPAAAAAQAPHRSTLDILLGRNAPPPKDL